MAISIHIHKLIRGNCYLATAFGGLCVLSEIIGWQTLERLRAAFLGNYAYFLRANVLVVTSIVCGRRSRYRTRKLGGYFMLVKGHKVPSDQTMLLFMERMDNNPQKNVVYD